MRVITFARGAGETANFALVRTGQTPHSD